MTNSHWYSLLHSKDIQLHFKNECMKIFEKPGIYTATKTFLQKFGSWRNMFAFRPRVRYDGIYLSKIEYWHDGLTEFGDRNPLHKIIYYMMIRFFKSGKIMYGQNVLEPEKFIELVQRGKYILDTGSFNVKNRELRAEIPIGKSWYYYTYALEGEVHNPSDRFSLK